MKRFYASDIETDELLDKLTLVWCASFSEIAYEKGVWSVVRTFTEIKRDGILEVFQDPDSVMIMHNGCGFDKPALEKIYGVELPCQVIDTLYLSWYLYPKNNTHGLAYWGEQLGIAKPAVEDWSTQPLSVYVHRCEEDVRIQLALWRQMWKHLSLLYDSYEAIMHCAEHLSFKASCAALKAKSRWKLDVDGTRELRERLSVEYEAAVEALERVMPQVPQYTVRKRPKEPFKMSGELSKHGERWAKIVEENVEYEGVAANYNKPIKVLTGYKEPNAGASGQVKLWLESLGWIPETFKFVREEDGSVRKIPQIKDVDKGTLCPSIERMIDDYPQLVHLRTMSVVKHRITVCDGFLNNMNDKGYVQALVQGLTNTLRFKHKVCLNIPSNRKPYGKEIRQKLKARSAKYELCGSDMQSLEDRTKQHYMWPYDPEYVKDMQRPGFDPHLDMCIMAKMLGPEDAAEYKELDAIPHGEHTPKQASRFMVLGNMRHAGKSTNYAATYGATGPTIARSAKVKEEIGNKLYDAYWRRNWSLKAIADNCIVKQSRGAKWLWNPVAKLWLYLKAEKDRFSTLNQSTGTYCFDRWLYHVLEQRPQLTAQFHDEGVWELLKGNREAMTRILEDAVAVVNKELKLNRELGCSVSYGDNYAEVH